MNNIFDTVLTDLDLIILKIMKEYPGLNARKITAIINNSDQSITIDRVKNSIKRHLQKYCEFKGAKSDGGYYLKK